MVVPGDGPKRQGTLNGKQCFECKRIRASGTRLWQSFKRTRGGSKNLGGNAVRPDVSDNLNSFYIPAQPFVKCQVRGVEVNALIDTGSMRTFISDNIQKIIDLDGETLNFGARTLYFYNRRWFTNFRSPASGRNVL